MSYIILKSMRQEKISKHSPASLQIYPARRMRTVTHMFWVNTQRALGEHQNSGVILTNPDDGDTMSVS